MYRIDVWVMVLTFLAVVVSAAGAYSLLSDLWLRDRRRVCDRVDAEFMEKHRARAQTTPLYKDLDRLAGELAAREPRAGWRPRLELLVEQSGIDIEVRSVVRAMWCAGIVLAAVGGLSLRSAWAALPGAALGAAIPLSYLAWRRGRRLGLLTTQLPDAFENMARALRAGHTMSQALQGIARDFDQPLAGEFAFCYERQNLGLAPQVSYTDLAGRVGLFELRIFALSMSVQQETGGNVAEVLDKLATGVRDRLRCRLRVRALTAESRLQATVLLVLPAVVFFALWVLKRDHAEMLLAQPRLLAGTLAAQVVGALWVRQIVQSED